MFYVLCLVFCQAYNESNVPVEQLEESLQTVSGKEKFKTLIELARYYVENNTDKAQSYAEQAVEMIKKEKPDTISLASLYNILGEIYYRKQEYKKSIKFYETELNLIASGKDKETAMRSYFNVAILCSKTGSYKKALEFHQQSLNIAKELNDQMIITRNLGEMSKLYYELFKFKEAYTYAQQYHNEYLKLYAMETESQVQILSSKFHEEVIKKEIEIKEKQQELKKRNIELEEKKTEIHSKDSALTRAAIIQEKLVNENINQSKYIGELSIESYLGEQKLLYQKKITRIVIQLSIVILVITVLVLVFYGKLRLAYRQIHMQKAEIQKQRDELKEKNNKITEGIQYAKRIQKAIIPPSSFLQKYFAEGFIIFQPKDIVSGDFYWYIKKGQQLIIAVADCTGHGVPGAFMSMLGIAYLNQIVDTKGITSPDEILNQLRREIIRTFEQEDIEATNKEGMDIAILSINTESNRMQFAGAHNSIYHFSDGQFAEIEADPMPVSQYKIMKPYNKKEISIKKGDCLYLFSDGYADQFGGTDKKKFFSGNFKKMLIAHHGLPMREQEALYQETLDTWKGNNLQTDDITLMGIRV